ncbi:MAG: biotin/lipoyl-containing protein, partial [Candidatus Krumholzibacteriia bacterium]
MPVDVTVPSLGESITEVQVSAWLKQPGDAVALDEPVIELESDKATVEVPAPAAGVVVEIVAEVGAVLKVGDVLARIDTEAKAKAEGEGKAKGKAEADAGGEEDGEAPDEAKQETQEKPAEPAGEAEAEAPADAPADTPADAPADAPADGKRVMPAARRVMTERGLADDQVEGTGPGGRV